MRQCQSQCQNLRRNATAVALVALLMAGLSPRASATWSVVLTDTATGEVAIASATCINNFNLEAWLPVVRVGVGVGAAQAAIDASGKNRKIIWDELLAGTGPFVILQKIAAQDLSFQARQIGIVDLEARSASHTGTGNAAYAGGVTGTIGTITYAIQGNILTGKAVINQAKQALEQATGDLADRMMALMLAAQAMGGDGRCSCSQSAPTSCGSPPATFTKSAHIGFMIVARIGDADGTCSSGGCANGSYYMNLNVTNTPAGVDPVFVLQSQFQAWRTSWTGHADQQKTVVSLDTPIANSNGSTAITIDLVDWQGVPTGQSGAVVSLTQESGPNGFATPGATMDLGNGRYTIPLLMQGIADEATYRITVDDGNGPVTLYPFTTVRAAPSDGLSTPNPSFSAGAGGNLPLAFAGGPALKDRAYLALTSISGTQPGFQLGGVHVPLVLDLSTLYSFWFCNTSLLVNTCATLDAAGATSMTGAFAPGNLAALVGSNLSFSLITLTPTDYASDPVSISITP